MFLLDIPSLFRLFRQGEALENAQTWKNRTVATNAVLAFLGTGLELAKLSGHAVDIDHDTLQDLAAGVVAAVAVGNALMHVICNHDVGMQPVNQPSA